MEWATSARDAFNTLNFKVSDEPMKRAIVVFIASMVAVAGAFSLLYIRGYVRFNYPDASRYPVTGIDISHHQGEIDWLTLKQENIKFVYMKATEGGNFKDPQFKRNWQLAAESDLFRGAYHFFSFCKSGREQAENYILTVPREANILPPAIDLEYGGNCSHRPDKEELLSELRDFIDVVTEAYGKIPLIYVTSDTYDDFLKGELESCMLWVNAVFREPRLSDGRDWHIWQYATNARLKGIEGPVDLDVFRGTQSEFAELFGVD